MRIFVINLDKSVDRWEHYKNDEKFERWSATSKEEVKEWDSEKMISYHNIHPDQHLAKCGCLKSHLNILSYIITNRMNDVLILEDDALVGDLSELDKLPEDGVTYLGGYTAHKKMTQGPLSLSFSDKINKIDNEKFRVLTTMAYYIPTHYVAGSLYDEILNRKRWRAIDVMLGEIKSVPFYLYYPALITERQNISQIRKDKSKKLCDKYYNLS
jgi:GR25 family glycosyltransferase involved in LPS biosynthesis